MRIPAFIGPRTALGAALALACFLADQTSKLWLLNIYDLGARGRVALNPFLDLILTWNAGISYGLFEQNGMAGQYVLAAFKVLVAIALFAWLARLQDKIGAVALGLIIGGALGNALDRLLYGAVVDFFSLHFREFYWYIFNVADIGIVAGVGLLLIDSFFISHDDGKQAQGTGLSS